MPNKENKKKTKRQRNSNIGADPGQERDSAGQQIVAAQDRLETLKERAALSKDPLLNEVLEELSSGLEELSVSEEELRQQNEELMAARQIQEAERQRYQDLFDLTPDGYLVTSPEGIIKEANRAAGLLLGVRQDHLNGKPLRVFINDRKAFDRLLSRFQKKEQTSIEEWDGLLIAREKGTFYARVIIAPRKDNQGKLTGLLWLIRDITERKQAEEAIQNLATQLLTTQENERKRIALEVHDVLGSSLSAIKFKVEEALEKNGNSGGDPSLSKSLEAVIPLVQDTIEEARRIQNDLRPPMLDDLGLIAAFSWLCRRIETIYSGLRVEQKMSIQEDEIPVPLKIALFRITQEAMNNIGKHAGATQVHLRLQKVNGTIELTIQDYGKGFDQELLITRKSSKRGMGLSSMKERTEILGGSFDIKSATGKGTTVRASWPI